MTDSFQKIRQLFKIIFIALYNLYVTKYLEILLVNLDIIFVLRHVQVCVFKLFL